MIDLIQAGRNYERSLEMMNEWIDEREEVIQARTDQIAEQMVRDMTPMAKRALREALEAREFDGMLLDLMHAMLWHGADSVAARKTSTFKARLCELAALEYTVQDEARAKAKKEIDGGAL